MKRILSFALLFVCLLVQAQNEYRITDFRDNLIIVSCEDAYYLEDNACNIIAGPFKRIVFEDYGLIRVDDESGCYLIKSDGTPLTKEKYIMFLADVKSFSDYVHVFSDGLCGVVDEEGRVGFIDPQGKMVIPCRDYGYFGDVSMFGGGFAAFKKDDKWGYIDKTGREIISPIYDHVIGFHNGFGFGNLDDQWYILDGYGRRIRKLDVKEIRSASDGFIVVSQGEEGIFSKRALMDFNGRLLTEFEYAFVSRTTDGYWLAAKQIGGTVTIFDKYGKMPFGEEAGCADFWHQQFLFSMWNITRPLFNSHGLTPINKDGNLLLMDSSGRVVKKFEFIGAVQNIGNYDSQTLWCIYDKTNNRQGLIKDDGTIVLAPVFDDIRIEEDKCIAKKGEETIMFNLH